MTKPRHAPHFTLGTGMAAVALADADLILRVRAALAADNERARRLRQIIQNAAPRPIQPEAWLAVLAPTKH
jgi:hypothetical protein